MKKYKKIEKIDSFSEMGKEIDLIRKALQGTNEVTREQKKEFDRLTKKLFKQNDALKETLIFLSSFVESLSIFCQEKQI
ncbi:MAG: hypothetical protein ABIJ97_01485 [Bacteroidota bacterium]